VDNLASLTVELSLLNSRVSELSGQLLYNILLMQEADEDSYGSSASCKKTLMT